MTHHTNQPMTQSQTHSTAARAAAQTVAHACGCSTVAAPTHDDIAKRAYDIYLKTGRKQGQCKQNWQQAEHSLSEQAAHPPQPRDTGAFTPHPATAH